MKPSSNAQKIPHRAIKAWRINNSLWSFLMWVVPLFFFVLHLTGSGRYGWFVLSVSVLTFLLTLFLIIFLPQIRWREWYYRVDEHELELQNGVIILQQTLVPINRVQHVDTRQGPILSSYNLADVIISTAATKHKIPALDMETADEVRKQISTFARKAREDV